MTIEAISDLKALPTPPSTIEAVYVLSHSILGDSGGETFYWSGSSNPPDNGGTVIIPASLPSTGRWMRLVEDFILVEWFGAKGDGVTDDTIAFNNALGVAMQYKLPLTMLGKTYLISETILIDSGPYEFKLEASIIGGTKIKFRNTVTNRPLISLTPNSSHSHVENIEFIAENPLV